MYATTTTGHKPHVSGSIDTKVIQQLIVWGNIDGTITQTATTTVEEWNGLSYDDVQTIYEASETSTLNGQTRNYLGGAILTQAGVSPAAYCWATGCWGTKVTTSFNRMGETNLYHVTKTTVEYTVSGSGATVLTLT